MISLYRFEYGPAWADRFLTARGERGVLQQHLQALVVRARIIGEASCGLLLLELQQLVSHAAGGGGCATVAGAADTLSQVMARVRQYLC